MSTLKTVDRQADIIRLILAILGAVLTLMSIAVLLAEAAGEHRASSPGRDDAPARRSSAAVWLSRPALLGGCLVAVSVFCGEFENGVAQYRMAWHPLLVFFGAGLVFVHSDLAPAAG